MKKTIIIILVTLIGNFGFSQEIDTTSMLNVALEQANKMNKLFQTGDYDNFIDFMHPKVVEMTGGKDSLKEMFESMKKQVEFISTDLTIPNKLIANDTLYQCVFAQKQVMKMNEKKFYVLGSLIGISYNSGVNWVFIAVTNNISFLKQQFPELSNDLELKPQKKPVFIE